jgi:hypothetical protein
MRIHAAKHGSVEDESFEWFCHAERTGLQLMEEEKLEQTQPLPTRPPHKVAVMALSLLDVVVIASDTDDRIVKVMDELQDFVSKVYENSLKQRSVDFCFKQH